MQKILIRAVWAITFLLFPLLVPAQNQETKAEWYLFSDPKIGLSGSVPVWVDGDSITIGTSLWDGVREKRIPTPVPCSFTLKVWCASPGALPKWHTLEFYSSRGGWEANIEDTSGDVKVWRRVRLLRQ